MCTPLTLYNLSLLLNIVVVLCTLLVPFILGMDNWNHIFCPELTLRVVALHTDILNIHSYL